MTGSRKITKKVPEFNPEVPGSDYIYVQLADHVTARIKAQELESGTRLPSERHLATQYGVSIGTVRRMTAQLRDRGLIITLPAKGTFVA